MVGLYPNLDPVCVAKLTAQAVRRSAVKFRSVNYCFLIVYLMLTLGTAQMERLGLGRCISKNKGKDNIRSLTATQKKNLENWDFDRVKLDDTDKKRFSCSNATSDSLALIEHNMLPVWRENLQTN